MIFDGYLTMLRREGAMYMEDTVNDYFESEV